MITKLLELLGLTAGQAGIGVMLIAGAIWARRAIIAGELLATGIRFGSVVAATVGLGVVSGVISIDLSVLLNIFAVAVEVVVSSSKAPVQILERLTDAACDSRVPIMLF